MEKSSKQEKNPISVMPKKPLGPWLVIFHGKRGEYQTFYSIEDDKYHVKKIPIFRRKFVSDCSHGWMVLNDIPGYCEFLLLNPTTMETIQLPPLDIYYQKSVLSSAPGDPTCTLLLVSRVEKNVMTFRFCSPQKNSKVIGWNKQEVQFNEDIDLISFTSCQGKIYGFSHFGEHLDIFIVEVVNESLTVRKLGVGPLPQVRDGLRFTRLLIESCGELYAIRVVYAESEIPLETINFQVSKLDFATMSWETVESLGNRAFFWGSMTTCSFSVPSEESECGIRANTIYFTMENEKSLYAFNLEDKSITLSLPFPNVQHNWSQPNWFLP